MSAPSPPRSSCRCASAANTGPALDSKFEILHLLVVASRRSPTGPADGPSPASPRPADVSAWASDTCHHVLALGIDQVFAVQFVFPVPGLRVKATPVAESLPRLPNTMVQMFTAVPFAMSGVILNSRR